MEDIIRGFFFPALMAQQPGSITTLKAVLSKHSLASTMRKGCELGALPTDTPCERHFCLGQNQTAPRRMSFQCALQPPVPFSSVSAGLRQDGFLFLLMDSNKCELLE